MARPAVVVALPAAESEPGRRRAGRGRLRRRRGPRTRPSSRPSWRSAATSRVAILDGETDFDESLEYYAALHDGGRSIPALMVVSPESFERLDRRARTALDDEYLTRPYSRRRRSAGGSRPCASAARPSTTAAGPILQGGADVDAGGLDDRRAHGHRGLQPEGRRRQDDDRHQPRRRPSRSRRGRSVLLIDADTVTGHVTTSLGHRGRARRVVRQLARRGRGRPAPRPWSTSPRRTRPA